MSNKLFFYSFAVSFVWLILNSLRIYRQHWLKSVYSLEQQSKNRINYLSEYKHFIFIFFHSAPFSPTFHCRYLWNDETIVFMRRSVYFSFSLNVISWAYIMSFRILISCFVVINCTILCDFPYLTLSSLHMEIC